MARYLEAMAFLNISRQASHGWSWQAGWKLVGPDGDAARPRQTESADGADDAAAAPEEGPAAASSRPDALRPPA